MTDLLAHSDHLHVLPEAFTKALDQATQVRKIPDGQWIFRRGDSGDDFYKLVAGRVQILGRNLDGRELTVSYLGPGEWFGEMSMLDGLPRTHDAIAKGDCTLATVRGAKVRALIAEHPEFGLAIARLLSARLRMMFGFIEDSVLRGLPARLAKRLLELGKDHGSETKSGSIEIDLHLPQEELATMLGATREAIGRHLRKWETESIVCLRYGRITVLAPDKLAALAELED